MGWVGQNSWRLLCLPRVERGSREIGIFGKRILQVDGHPGKGFHSRQAPDGSAYMAQGIGMTETVRTFSRADHRGSERTL